MISSGKLLFRKHSMAEINEISNKFEKEVKELSKKVDAVSNDLKYMKITEKTLRRYLRAFRSVDAAYERILQTNAWRGKNSVSSITGDSPGIRRVQKTKLAVILNERDARKRPIAYVAARNHSIYNRDVNDMTEFIIYFLEETCKRCNEEDIDNLCIVFDLKDFSLSCMDYQMLKTLYEILTDHYPERLGVCLVLNAPFIFWACWRIIRMWIDENTASKISFVNDNETLSTFLDPKILPRDM